MALLIHAHPYPNRSRANRALLAGVRSLPGLEVRSLYDLYPDFDIDVEAEQAALSRAKLVLWQHPMYWYSVPGLFKHWFDQVLSRGWAYGDGGNVLHGKYCLWVTTTGGNEQAFSVDGMHSHPLAEFSPVVEQTARFCGMKWLEPFVLHGAHLISDAELHGKVASYRERVSIAMAELEVE